LSHELLTLKRRIFKVINKDIHITHNYFFTGSLQQKNFSTPVYGLEKQNYFINGQLLLFDRQSFPDHIITMTAF